MPSKSRKPPSPAITPRSPARRRVIVRDLYSTNGTFINGQQVTGEAPLKPGQSCASAPSRCVWNPASRGRQAKQAQALDQTRIIPPGRQAGRVAGPAPRRNFKPRASRRRATRGRRSSSSSPSSLGWVLIVALAIVLFGKGLL
jgi:hypothetical protein